MATDVKINHIVGAVGDLDDKQLGIDDTAHGTTSNKHLNYRDDDSNTHRCANLEEPAVFTDLTVTGSFSGVSLDDALTKSEDLGADPVIDTDISTVGLKRGSATAGADQYVQEIYAPSTIVKTINAGTEWNNVIVWNSANYFVRIGDYLNKYEKFTGALVGQVSGLGTYFSGDIDCTDSRVAITAIGGGDVRVYNTEDMSLRFSASVPSSTNKYIAVSTTTLYLSQGTKIRYFDIDAESDYAYDAEDGTIATSGSGRLSADADYLYFSYSGNVYAYETTGHTQSGTAVLASALWSCVDSDGNVYVQNSTSVAKYTANLAALLFNVDTELDSYGTNPDYVKCDGNILYRTVYENGGPTYNCQLALHKFAHLEEAGVHVINAPGNTSWAIDGDSENATPEEIRAATNANATNTEDIATNAAAISVNAGAISDAEDAIDELQSGTTNYQLVTTATADINVTTSIVGVDCDTVGAACALTALTAGLVAGRKIKIIAFGTDINTVSVVGEGGEYFNGTKTSVEITNDNRTLTLSVVDGGYNVVNPADAQSIWASPIEELEDAEISGGLELATNGSFSSDTEWTKGTGWTIEDGLAKKVAGSSSSISQTLASGTIDYGETYVLEFHIETYISGSVGALVGDAVSYSASAGLHTAELVPTSGTTIGLTTNATFAGEISYTSLSKLSTITTINKKVCADASSGSVLYSHNVDKETMWNDGLIQHTDATDAVSGWTATPVDGELYRPRGSNDYELNKHIEGSVAGQNDFPEWRFGTSTTLAAGSGTDSTTVISDEIVPDDSVLLLHTVVYAIVEDGDGAVWQAERWDTVGYDGEVAGGATTERQNTLTDIAGLTGATVALASNGSDGKLNVVLSHTTSGSTVETTVNYKVVITGARFDDAGTLV